MAEKREWTASDVETILLDVRTTGVGGFPAVVDEKTWIAANAKMIADMGAEAYLKAFLDNLRTAFG